jgi:GTP-binding protein
MKNPFQNAKFLISAAKLNQLPADIGFEVAFAGRSNAGKSSALNTLTNQKSLARTSKTPGRTQLINLFEMDLERRLVDLPGYGFAKVSEAMKKEWQKTMGGYLDSRGCLKGMVLLMDIRHPLKDTDVQMLEWAVNGELPVHILLSKADKLSKNEQNKATLKVRKELENVNDLVSVQAFSSLKKQGLEQLKAKLCEWYMINADGSNIEASDVCSEQESDVVKEFVSKDGLN